MTIWFNVSTSAQWRRPPLGIVRVESRLAEALPDRLGPERLRFCVWDQGIKRFVPWDAPLRPASLDFHIANDLPGPLGTSPQSGRREALRLIARGVQGLAPERLKPTLARMGTGAEGVLIQARERFRLAASQLRVGRRDRRYRTRESWSCLSSGDVLFTVGLDWETGFAPVLADLRSRVGFRVIGCCHDLIPIKYPHYAAPGVAKVFGAYLSQLASYSDAIACVSQCTLTDLRQFLSTIDQPTGSLFRIHLGTDVPDSGQATSQAVVAAASHPFILYVSTVERRKNHELLYRVLRRLAERYPQSDLPRLIFVGSIGWGIGELLNDIALDPLTQGLILVLDGVSDSDLKFLYEKALFCVFPSLYEGWGIPVAEALALHKPVICSNQGSIPEVGGDLVEYLDPWDLPNWVKAIEQLWLDTALREQRADRILRYYRPESWSTTARECAEAAMALDSHSKRCLRTMGASGD